VARGPAKYLPCHAADHPPGTPHDVTGDRAELSSVITQLRELNDRITAVAERVDLDVDEQGARSLFDAERALRTAIRAVERAADQLR